MVFNRVMNEKQGKNQDYLIKLEILEVEAWNAQTLNTLKKWKQCAPFVHLLFSLCSTNNRITRKSKFSVILS